MTPTPQTDHLHQWLVDERSERFLGRAFRVKLDCLALLAGGVGSVATIATEHRVSREIVRRHVRNACRAFELPAEAEQKVLPS
jgi:hypothetical protein